MRQKKSFKPVIARIKLNPEQAVLACCVYPSKGKVAGGNQCANASCGTSGISVTAT